VRRTVAEPIGGVRERRGASGARPRRDVTATSLPAVAWLVILSLLVLGPLLAPGYLLLLDAPTGPAQPSLAFLPLPSRGLYSVGAPTSVFVTAATQAIGLVAPQLVNKLLIALAIVAGGSGLYRFARRTLRLSRVPSITAATFFVINPFVYDRLLAGQLFLILGYATLPWVLLTWLAIATDSKAHALYKAIAWSFCIGLVSVHFGAIAALLTIAAVIASPRALLRRLRDIATVTGWMLLLNAYWLLPSALAGEATRLGVSNPAAFASRPRSDAVIAHLLLLQGFWRTEFRTPLSNAPVVFLTAFTVLALLATLGVVEAYMTPRWRRAAVSLTVTTVIAVVLAAGTSYRPTASLTTALFGRMPGYALFREPQKWLAVLALAYAVFMGVGLQRLLEWLRRRGVPLLLGASPLIPLIATPSLLWGFGGQVAVSSFPSDWERAAAMVQAEPGPLLFLPWHEFQPFSFAGSRILRTPADHYFPTAVRMSHDDEFAQRRTAETTDPRERYVALILHHRGSIRHLGHLAAPLGVRYIALAHEADASDYGFLSRQRDLHLLIAGRALDLYENRAWTGSTYSLRPSSGVASLAQLTADSRAQLRAAHDLSEWPPLVPAGKADAEPPLSHGSFLRRTITDVRGPAVGTDDSCLDGWQLDGRQAGCHLGAFAAFPKPDGQFLPQAGSRSIQLLGYLLSGIAAAAGLWALRTPARITHRGGHQH
jgi:hypothetical protein